MIFTLTEGHALIIELWAPLPNFRLLGHALIFGLIWFYYTGRQIIT